MTARLRRRAMGACNIRVAQSGEVLSAGGKVLNIVDLKDVYMTFFPPYRVGRPGEPGGRDADRPRCRTAVHNPGESNVRCRRFSVHTLRR